MSNNDNTPKCFMCGSKIISPKRGYRSNTTENYICEDCVKILHKAMQESLKPQKRKRKDIIKPHDMKEELDKYVIGQDDAKIALSIAVYNHYKRMKMNTDVKMAKSNIMLIGPTGSGKTLLAQSIAEMLDVPFAIADCTSLTEAGYVGDDVESVLLKLINAADGDVEKAEKGIIFLDEIDKLAKANVGASLTKDPSGEGVQQALLKLIEGTVANVAPHGGRKNPSERCIQVNTENILFICGGAFPGMEKIINQRLNTKPKSIGFGNNVETDEEKSLTDSLKLVSTDDLKSYGLIPELIGRIPVIVSLDELDENAMMEILEKPKNSIVNQYKEYFRYDGVELIFTKNALKEIAKETIKRKTGARGLRGIMEEVLKKEMYDIPSEENVEKCIVDGINKITLVRTEGKKEAC